MTVKRGQKPKPPEQHAAAGTARPARHGNPESQEKKRQSAREMFGVPVKPDGLSETAGRAWDRYIEPAYWLDGTREVIAVMFVQLYAEYMEAPAKCGATKIAQLRSLMAELGLTDERNRVTAGDEDGDDPYLD